MALDARMKCKRCAFRHVRPERSFLIAPLREWPEKRNRMKSISAVAERAQQTLSVRWALASLSLSMLLSSLGTSIANVGLPTLAQVFNASFQHVQWIVLAYLLAITTLIVSV